MPRSVLGGGSRCGSDGSDRRFRSGSRRGRRLLLCRLLHHALRNRAVVSSEIGHAECQREEQRGEDGSGATEEVAAPRAPCSARPAPPTSSVAPNTVPEAPLPKAAPAS